jgi:putative cardiolipin synthase
VTWRVDLDEQERMRWTYDYEGERLVVHREPQAGWGRRLMARFYRILPIEGQL